jgi:Tfp pilus assembly protein PilV
MRQSFSLIEVLIFISILSVFLVTSASIVTVSMHQNAQKINKLKATHYNNQLLEWIRTEKELDWNGLVARGTPTSVYCFCTETLAWTVAVADKADCCPTPLKNIYKRYIILTAGVFAPSGFTTSSQIEVEIQTEWQEGGNSYSARLNTLFSPWEE